LAPQNRYNEAGKPALYLCTDSSAVGRELPGLSNVWIQQFSVPVETLRIADLRSPEANDRQLLASLLWFAELAGAEGHCSQDFSRFVASMISKQFDGMLVSGVRGDSSFYYSNLVLFRPDDKWREWLSSELPMPFERKAV
jgi:hypothetical protein